MVVAAAAAAAAVAAVVAVAAAVAAAVVAVAVAVLGPRRYRCGPRRSSRSRAQLACTSTR